MTQEQAQYNKESINHFTNKGKLWYYSVELKNWNIHLNPTFESTSPTTYIIEDKHFEVRKAHAMGEPIEFYNDYTETWNVVNNPSFGAFTNYRVQPTPVFYYKWEKLVGDTIITTSYTSDAKFSGDWERIEASKRTWND